MRFGARQRDRRNLSRFGREGAGVAFRRFLAHQFARPTGPIGRWVIGPWLDRIARSMNRVAFEQLKPGPGEHVLEVGFGGGDLIEWVVGATAARVTGVEISEAMLKRARRRFSQELAHGKLELLLAGVEDLPLAAGSVDKACSVNSLYFWPDPAAALAELARVTRPGGGLVLCFQTPEAVRAWPGHVHGFRAYGADEVGALMEGASFRTVDIRTGEDGNVGEFICLSGERKHGR